MAINEYSDVIKKIFISFEKFWDQVITPREIKYLEKHDLSSYCSASTTSDSIMYSDELINKITKPISHPQGRIKTAERKKNKIDLFITKTLEGDNYCKGLSMLQKSFEKEQYWSMLNILANHTEKLPPEEGES